MKVYKLVTVNESVLNAFKTLMPQLTPHVILPTKNDIEFIVNSNNTIIFLAEENNQIIGTLTLVFNKIPTGDKVWIEDVVVDESARGKGAAKALIQFAISYSVNKNIKKINLTSSPERIAANKLYQKLGFLKRETNVYRLVVE